MILKDSSNLASVGQRVMKAGFTFIWVRSKLPCFISPDCKSTIIFDVSGCVPVYSPCMEEMTDNMLGSFKLDANVFKDHCGISVTKRGTIEIDSLPEPKTSYASSFRQKMYCLLLQCNRRRK